MRAQRLPLRLWSVHLRRGWRYLTTRYLVVSSVPLLMARVITTGLGLARNTLLTNLLVKEDFGALNYLLSWLSVVALLCLPGLNMAIAQYVAKGHWSAVRLGLRRRLLLAPLPMIVLAVFGWVSVQSRQSNVVSSLWFLSALFFPTVQVLGLVGGILGALQRFRRLAVYYVVQSAAFLLAAAIGLWLWPYHAITGIVLFQWLLLSLLNLSAWVRLHRLATERIPLPPAQRGQFYHLGTHLTAMNALGQVRGLIGALLLGGLVSLSSLADYAVADLFFTQMKALWTIYYGVSSPRVISLSPRDRWRQVGREARLATPAFAALAAVVGVGLSVLVPWLFSVKYISSLPYIWILLLAFVCSVPGGFFEMYFRAEESTKSLYYISLAAAVAALLLPPLLLIVWGPLGVPAGRAAAYLVYSLVGFVLYRRQRA